VHDIVFLDRFADAKARAKAQGKPVLLKPFDQGLLSDEHW
jgi:hypothetical protein